MEIPILKKQLGVALVKCQYLDAQLLRLIHQPQILVARSQGQIPFLYFRREHF